MSSDGPYARKKLRECEGLVESILHIVKAAIGKNDIDNKPVENCVCILRNLSYACQEVHDPDYLKKRSAAQADKGGQLQIAYYVSFADNIFCGSFLDK